MQSDDRWAFLYSLRFLLPVTIIGGLLGELAHHGIKALGLRDVLPPLLGIPLPVAISGALFPYLLIRLVYQSSLRDFGVRWVDSSRPALRWLLGSCGLALLLWFVFWGIIVAGFTMAQQNAPDSLPMTLAEFHEQNPLLRLINGEGGASTLAYVLHMTIFVGFAEELFGRGLLQNALDRRYARVFRAGRFSLRLSTIVAALLFAFWHTEWTSLDPLTILGSLATSMTIVLVPSLMLCIVYEKTRSMIVVILLHNVIDGGKLVTWYLWSLILPG